MYSLMGQLMLHGFFMLTMTFLKAETGNLWWKQSNIWSVCCEFSNFAAFVILR